VANAIRLSPLGYLRGLVRRARAGEFTPEVAFQVESARQRRRQAEIRQHQAEVAYLKDLPTASLAENNPLVDKLMAIRNRRKLGNKDNE
jgi:hypothetical protein